MPDYLDRLSKFSSDAWAQCWNDFYNIQPSQSTQGAAPAEPTVTKADSYPHVSRDTLSNAELGLMPDAGDTLVRHTPPDFTNLVKTGQAGSTSSYIDVNYIPKGIFEYIPAWLYQANLVRELQETIQRSDLRKGRISRELKGVSGAIVSMVQRLAGDALANVSQLFRGDRFAKQLRLLKGHVIVIAGKVAQQAKSWASKAVDSLLNNLSAASTWADGALSWCQSQWQRALNWLSGIK